jgi:lipid A disaccharide synthetase
MDKEIVVELIQKEVSIKNIQKELDALIFDNSNRDRMLYDYNEMRKLLGKEGCSKKIAQDLIGYYSK